METLFLNEPQLACRWGVSPKTLQRWRMDGRGPRYLKLSKRVVYPIEDILDFEDRSAYLSTSARAENTAPYGEDLLSAKEIAKAMKLPHYIFSNPRIRKQLKVPHIRLNTQLRFNISDVEQWADAWKKQWDKAGAPERFVISDIPVNSTVISGDRHD
jgi:predicted DNA-binding transcriptional regulator AlpA